MATIVWGHGTRDRGEERTFVPAGSTVKWYSEVDENLLTLNGFLAISSGSFSAPVETFGPGEGVNVGIYNYAVSADREKWDYVGILNDQKNELLFIGGDVPEGHLCNDLDGCRNAGEHKCDGVLGKVGANKEVVVMVCRGIPGGDADTRQFGGKADDVLADFQDDVDAFINDLYRKILSDPEQAEKDFDSLPTASLAMFAPYPFIKAWKAVRWAADAGRRGDVASMWDQMHDEEGNAEAEQFLKVARYKEGITAGAQADPDAFFGHLDRWTALVYRQIEEIPEVMRLRQIWGAKNQLADQEADGGWSPTDADHDQISATNARNVKEADDGEEMDIQVGGIVMLIGGGHGAERTGYVRRQQDFEEGTARVKKGGAFSKGTLNVTGISAKRDLVTRLVGEFSDKKVNFD